MQATAVFIYTFLSLLSFYLPFRNKQNLYRIIRKYVDVWTNSYVSIGTKLLSNGNSNCIAQQIA